MAMKSEDWIMLAVILVPMIALMIFIFALAYDRKDYDERQKQVQGRAYAAAYFVLLLSTVGFALIQLLAQREWLNTLSLLIVGMVLSLLVHSLICIFGDAFVKLKVKQHVALGCMGALIVLYCIQALLDGKPLLRNGQFSSGALELMMAGYYVIVLLAYTGKQLYNRWREGRE